MENVEKFTKGEEIANSVIHGVGAAASFPACILLIFKSIQFENDLRLFGFIVYGLSLIILYVSSTLYHSAWKPSVKNVLEIFDHCSVYILIAGTNTPLALVLLPGISGIVYLYVIWGIAFAGIILKAFMVKKMVFISTFIYIIMGWLVIFMLPQMIKMLPFMGLFWLFLGGILYTAGTTFYIWRKVLYHHAVWHTFVLAGSICHYILVIFYLLPLLTI